MVPSCTEPTVKMPSNTSQGFFSSKLLVTEAQAAVVLVDLEYFHFDVGTHLSKFSWGV